MIRDYYRQLWAFQVVLVVKYLSTNAGDVKDVGSIPGLGRLLEKTAAYSCLENSMNRGTWLAIVHGIAKSQKSLSTYAGYKTSNYTMMKLTT